MTIVSTSSASPRPRSRLRARLVLAALTACGLAALAWAAFVSPLPRLTYNPSDSVAVGWYRIEPFDPRTATLPRPLSVDSIVLMPLPADVAALAAQRGYLPTHVPLLKRVGAVAPQHVCNFAGQVRIDGVPSAAALPADQLGRPLPSLQLCRRLAPGELFLLSATNPASFDSRYFGPVNAATVIGVAHPVWLEARP
ncbi:signal peptidase, peptidase S26 family protein [Burkholderia ambifaria AMMD]|uniref:Conjugation peptidase TraF, Serine peptidase, MEROPS family S26C n=1 Tax=Burkholderia ambifaria (strain ATCC BAA-244 / DSM 16087 / CCUG 44356 / LMG 19182 / AMMD) TaxID=339670 RepID=Q0BE79_BURCM|nr:S26 family signal peptidase [Burkholderia ambifaria]ABI87544.1 conjugation peptidase TraF, Serine peptidase, MEROPS family S26C [Burkholderia ambifaria AMMD]AJY21039.1 signal peptidase, peptidase S26 family protein [Burkholderia ambifaria AMMD]MBR7929036.1 S26 family signal peptidase [Burkholderia ambifaria]PEH65254.1 peptidase [Burkholderia ambifaria]QQC05246.1 S26 family signal peptidase [Burkholderia ambifaria]